MAKMTWAEKDGRRNARYWGKACQSNMGMVEHCAREERLWLQIADRMRKQGGEDSQSAIEHAEERARYNRDLVEHQLGQVLVNARRAFHAAINARDGEAR